MEFFYEEQALANDPHENKDKDEKTEKAFHKLEDEVSKRYDETSQALKNFVSEAEDGVKFNLSVDTETSEKAQHYLERLDCNLQNMEKAAQGYWNKFSNADFWTNVTANLGDKLGQIVQLRENEGNETTGQTAVGGNRTETELKILSTDKSIYLDNRIPLPMDFDEDSRTQEVSKILEKDVDLANLMKAIVPQEISYKDFWNTYFTHKQRILEMETSRKKILENKETNVEEEIAWEEEGEDEEETNDNDNQEEQPVVIKKMEPVDNKKQNAEEEKSKTINAEEEDDDWE